MATTTGPLNASILLIYLGGNVVAHTTDITFKLDNAMVDVTTRNSNGWKETLAGIRTWSLAVTGVVAFDDTTGWMAFVQGVVNRSLFTVKFSTGITGDFYFSGNGHISATGSTAKMETGATFTGTVEGTGPLTIGTN